MHIKLLTVTYQLFGKEGSGLQNIWPLVTDVFCVSGCYHGRLENSNSHMIHFLSLLHPHLGRRDTKGQRRTKLDTNWREHLQRTLKDVLTGEKGNDRSLSASLHTHQGDLFSNSINISAMLLSGPLICWELLRSNVLGTRQKVKKTNWNLCSVLCTVSI